MKTQPLFSALLLCLLLLVLSACGASQIHALPAESLPPAATPNPVDPDKTTPPPLEEEISVASDTDLRPQAEDSATDTANMLTVYESDLGFCLSIPPSWMSAAATESGSAVKQLYAAEETENAVRFYNIANAEAGFGGTLVTIRLFSPGEDYLYLPDFELLAETDEGSYVAIFPTDVQADPGSEELLARQLTMTKDIRSSLEEGFLLK